MYRKFKVFDKNVDICIKQGEYIYFYLLIMIFLEKGRNVKKKK